jgi:hypothetical protein
VLFFGRKSKFSAEARKAQKIRQRRHGRLRLIEQNAAEDRVNRSNLNPSVFFLRVVLGMERGLVGTTVSHMGHAHDKHSDKRSCHGRFTQGPEAQLARALFKPSTQLDSL